MTFDSNSGLVIIWGNMVLRGKKTIDQVPKIYNLREAVAAYVEERTPKAEEEAEEEKTAGEEASD